MWRILALFQDPWSNIFLQVQFDTNDQATKFQVYILSIQVVMGMNLSFDVPASNISDYNNQHKAYGAVFDNKLAETPEYFGEVNCLTHEKK